jgi:hypothetical protein
VTEFPASSAIGRELKNARGRVAEIQRDIESGNVAAEAEELRKELDALIERHRSEERPGQLEDAPATLGPPIEAGAVAELEAESAEEAPATLDGVRSKRQGDGLDIGKRAGGSRYPNPIECDTL